MLLPADEWSRPLFNLTSNYKSLSKEEREQRDYEQIPKRRRTRFVAPDDFFFFAFEPRQDKTCLREFPTRPDANRPAQPQKLARVFRFRL